MKTRLTLIIILLSFCTITFAQQKIKTEKLLSDFDFAVENFKTMHQGLFKYENKTTTDQKINTLRQSIQKPMTKLDFYVLLRKLITLTNEAHTTINLPKWQMLKVGFPKSLLPLSVKFCDKQLIINQNYGENTEGIAQGDRIISINGKTAEEMVTDLFPLIPTDGFNTTSQYEWGGGINFSLLYRLVYGKNKNYTLEIENKQTKVVQKFTIPAIRYLQFKSKNAKFKVKHFEYNYFVIKILNDSTAYLSIPSFNRAINYEKYYKNAFQKIKQANIKHLILDIQANGGGTEGNENLLYSYLSEPVISKYRAVTMLPKPYQINKTDKDYILDKWQLDGEIAKRGKYTLQSDYYSDLDYQKPEKELVYNGELYVLISGVTFSGGAELASLLKMTNRAVFIGEEVGGAYEGNVSGYSETIKLPNTKISISIPTVNYQIKVNPKQKGHGVIPDYNVPQTQNDYINEQNAKLNFAIKLITKK